MKRSRSNLWVPITCFRADYPKSSTAQRWQPGLKSCIQKTHESSTSQPSEWGTHSPPRSAVPHRARCPAAITPGCVGIGAALGNSETLEWARHTKELGFWGKKIKDCYQTARNTTQYHPQLPLLMKTGYFKPQPGSSELGPHTSSHRFKLFPADLLLAWCRSLHKQKPHQQFTENMVPSMQIILSRAKSK